MAREQMSKDEVKAIREKLGWTQAELAENLGVNQSAVAHWEAGNRNPAGPVVRLLKMLVAKIPKKSTRNVLTGR
jgi:DNA-binding transcriptional regulator YiaG